MLEVKNLRKVYPSFELKGISFTVEQGYIVGFIGTNGAGKTTTLKCLLNIVHPDDGEVVVFGRDIKECEVDVKQDIGFMLGAVDYYSKTKIKTVTGVYKKFYKNWEEARYEELLKKFNLDENKRISELSAGMRVKLGIAMALSHNAKLLIFDEPTSGLDPIARDELLDIFQEVVETGERSILFSTHITSDLDKCADYILFIRDGEIISNDTKDDILAKHAVVEGTLETLTEDLKERMISYKKNRYGFIGLMLRENIKEMDKITVEKPNLEDIMVYYNKEGHNL